MWVAVVCTVISVSNWTLIVLVEVVVWLSWGSDNTSFSLVAILFSPLIQTSSSPTFSFLAEISPLLLLCTFVLCISSGWWGVESCWNTYVLNTGIEEGKSMKIQDGLTLQMMSYRCSYGGRRVGFYWTRCRSMGLPGCSESSTRTKALSWQDGVWSMLAKVMRVAAPGWRV